MTCSLIALLLLALPLAGAPLDSLINIDDIGKPLLANGALAPLANAPDLPPAKAYDTWTPSAMLHVSDAPTTVVYEVENKKKTKAFIRFMHCKSSALSKLLSGLDVKLYAENAIKIHKALRNEPHVMNVLDTVEDANWCGIVTEHASQYTLEHAIINKAYKQRGEKEYKDLFKQLVTGLSDIHSKGYALRGITAATVFVVTLPGKPGVFYKYGSFYSAVAVAERDKFKQAPFDKRYASPEQMEQSAAANPVAVDVYSLGITLYVAWTSDFPNHAGKREEKKGFVPTTWDAVPEAFKPVLQGMTDPDATKRWTLKQVQDHPWFKSA